MRTALVIVLAALGLAVPEVASAATDVLHEDGRLDGTFHDLNICGWPATFTTSGRFQFESVTVGDIHGHFAYHEAVNWTLVIDDDPSVPEAFRGAIWRGRNEESIVGNFDPLSFRGMFVRLNPFSEGPFHGLVEQLVFVRAEDGTVTVEKIDFVGEADCASLV